MTGNQKMKPLLLSIEDTRMVLGGRARNIIYELIKDGELKSVTHGGRRFVLTSSVEAYVASLPLDMDFDRLRRS